MTRSVPQQAIRLALPIVGILIAVCVLLSGPVVCAQGQPAAAQTAPIRAVSPYIDSHTHFDQHDPAGAVQAALRGLSVQNAARIVLQIPPNTFDDPGRYDADVILAAARKHPDKLTVLGGGGTLNAMIIRSAATGDAGPEVQRKFKEQAETLLRDGVSGFGEMTAEHFPSTTPYQYAPPDHPLFLLLADIAAQRNVPIVMHMEAVPANMPLPSGLKSPPNPPQLKENIVGFERLLRHNRRANIVWAHIGRDLTGHRTPELCRRLLAAHPNLYMDLKIDPLSLGKNPILVDGANGKIRPDWLKLFEDFPDRMVIGSDQHYGPHPSSGPQRWQSTVYLLNQLPAGLRQKIGVDNAMNLFFSKSGKGAVSGTK